MKLFFSRPNDADIVSGILGPDAQARRKAENALYHKYQYFMKDAQFKHKIEAEEASMAYSDAILASIEHVASGRFEGRSELKTYIYQIFSNKCVDLLRRRATKEKYITSLDTVLQPLPDKQQSAIMQLIKSQDVEYLVQQLAKLGERCQALLKSWATGYTDAEQALEYGYNTAGVVQTTRLRCMEKLRDLYYMNQKESKK